MTVSLQPMTAEDLGLVGRWLREAHVARWWPPDLEFTAELRKYASRIRGDEPTHMVLVHLDGVPIGWCQWYRWADYPADGAACGAGPDDLGIDYAIGDASCIGRGVGTAMIAALLQELRRLRADVLTTPHADNVASRRVLEKNGFRLVATRELPTEPLSGLSAIYRLSGRSPSPGTPARR